MGLDRSPSPWPSLTESQDFTYTETSFYKKINIQGLNANMAFSFPSCEPAIFREFCEKPVLKQKLYFSLLFNSYDKMALSYQILTLFKPAPEPPYNPIIEKEKEEEKSLLITSWTMIWAIKITFINTTKTLKCGFLEKSSPTLLGALCSILSFNNSLWTPMLKSTLNFLLSIISSPDSN